MLLLFPIQASDVLLMSIVAYLIGLAFLQPWDQREALCSCDKLPCPLKCSGLIHVVCWLWCGYELCWVLALPWRVLGCLLWVSASSSELVTVVLPWTQSEDYWKGFLAPQFTLNILLLERTVWNTKPAGNLNSSCVCWWSQDVAVWPHHGAKGGEWAGHEKTGYTWPLNQPFSFLLLWVAVGWSWFVCRGEIAHLMQRDLQSCFSSRVV